MLNQKTLPNQIARAVEEARRTNPLIGSITNTVTINLVANTQLAVGGSAAMVYLPDEATYLAQYGRAFYLNTGTLLPLYEQTVPLVAETLYEQGKPWVLDPVGIGIGSLRTSLLDRLKEFKPSIIRLNASEAIALAKLWNLEGGTVASQAHGVDSANSVTDARAAAVSLARWTGGAVAVSGEVDLITDGSIVAYSHGGSLFLGKITGAGCSLAGVVATYAAVASPFIAALSASAIYNLAARRAEKESHGPGSFQVTFIDELYQASAGDVADNPFDIEKA